jgi:urocanate hydratase
MGGAQPLAATMNGAAFLCVEIDSSRLLKKARHERFLSSCAVF